MSVMHDILLLSVAALTIGGLHAENIDGVPLFRVRRADPSDINCSTKTFETLSKCCKKPVDNLFSPSLANSCDKIATEENVPAYLKEYKLHKLQDAKQGNAIILTGNSSLKTFGPVSCLVECVFRNQNLINDDATVNFDAVKNNLTSAASSFWKKTVGEVVKNCSVIVQGSTVTTITVPLSPPVTCLIQPALLMQCVLMNLITNCPGKNTAKSCNVGRSNVESCDPFKNA